MDNLARSIEQLGRVAVDMIPRVYNTKRQARILGEDNKHSFISVDPQMQQAVRRDRGGSVVAINPGVGQYDVRVEIGPSYTSGRQEAAQNIIDISQGNPMLGAALAPLLMKLRDMPESDKAEKIALALLPPAVQQAYNDGEEQQPGQQNQDRAKTQQMMQMLQQAGQELQALQEQHSQMAAENEQLKSGIQKAQIDAQSKQAVAGISAQGSERDRQLAQWRAEFDRETQMMLQSERDEAKLRELSLTLAAQQMCKTGEGGEGGDAKPAQADIAGLEQMAASIQMLAQTMMMPKRLIRDAQGRPAGVESVGM